MFIPKHHLVGVLKSKTVPATEAIAPIGINLSETGVKLKGEMQRNGKGSMWKCRGGGRDKYEERQGSMKPPVCSHPHHVIFKPSGPSLIFVILITLMMSKLMMKMNMGMMMTMVDLVSS